jgi:hypothetical protein
VSGETLGGNGAGILTPCNKETVSMEDGALPELQTTGVDMHQQRGVTKGRDGSVPTVWCEETMPDKRTIAILDFPVSQSRSVFAKVIELGFTLDSQMENESPSSLVGLRCGADAVDSRRLHWLPLQPVGPVIQTFWFRPDFQNREVPLPELGTREYTMLLYNELENNANPTQAPPHHSVPKDMSIYTKGVLTRVLDSIDRQKQRRHRQLESDRADDAENEAKMEMATRDPMGDLHDRIAAQPSTSVVTAAPTEDLTPRPWNMDERTAEILLNKPDRDAAIAGDPELACFDLLNTQSDGSIPNDAGGSFGNYVELEIEQSDVDNSDLDAMMESTLMALNDLFVTRCGAQELPEAPTLASFDTGKGVGGISRL